MEKNIEMSANIDNMLKFASEVAKLYNGGEVATEYILLGILCIRDSFACNILNKNGVDESNFREILAESKDDEETTSNEEIVLTPKSKQVFLMAKQLGQELKSDKIDVEHIFFCILMNSDCVAVNILDKVFNVNIIELKNKTLDYLKQLKVETKPLTNNAETPKIDTNNVPDELANLGSDLTQKARDGKIETIIGRDKEIERLIEILCRKTKNNPCLIGEAGVGKSAIVEGLALKIISDDVPNELKNKIIFSLDLAGLMAGTKFRGVLEQKLRGAIDAIIKNGNIILFIDEIHSLVQTSSEKGEVSPADILKPYLARGELKTIGATTTDEYRKYFEKDKALERRFQTIVVNPPSKQDTYQILKGIRDSYEAFHFVKISDSALKTAIDLADRYITERNFPDKAIDLIDEASSRAKIGRNNVPPDIVSLKNQVVAMQKQKKHAVCVEDYEDAIELRDKIFEFKAQIEKLNAFYGIKEEKQIVGGEDIASVVSLWTGIPVTKLTETETQKLLSLEEILHHKVVGQEEAISNVCRAIRRSRVGIRSTTRPIGSFLFLGPTGVGKTELSKAVAGALFDDEKNLIRLDMSEYMESNSVSKLIGSPPGYVGFDDGGQLTEKVRQKPYSVVLFDEIEKAHGDVLNILLQILDDGRLTDSQGRLINFQNTIIIMTSNIGSMELSEEIANISDSNKKDEIINNYLKDYMRPELINRIDSICVFTSLSEQNLAEIANIMLTSLVARLNKMKIQLKLSENALTYLITKGYNKEFGARPLRRLIEQEIEDVISGAILSGELKQMFTTFVDEKDGKLTFEYLKN